MKNSSLRWVAALTLAGLMLSGCGFRRKKYENPITKDTEQPDKVLFDKATADIEKGRYEVARLTLNTLMNTYDTSEFMAKAKLAIADSWMREGGSHSLAQAEAEYKDFILFYPTMEESAEAQEKVCMIHYKQIEKADRDSNQALRAEDECRNVLLQFPNSKFAPRVAQMLRNIQEVIAEGEFRRGEFYFKKGSFPSAANRLEAMVNHYPLFSKADQSLWMTAKSYAKLGDRFKDRAVSSYQRIVKDYPLSPLADEAKKELKAMERDIPEPDAVAVARMKYEQENYVKPGMMAPFWGIFKRGPDTATAAKSGNPAMTSLRPSIPVSIPTPEATAAAAGTAAGPTGEVTLQPLTGPSELDKKDDARLGKQGDQPAQPAAAAAKEEAPKEEAKPVSTAPQTKNKKEKPKKQKK
ncbi:MAG: outer membrane protein assembly factor BamD [Bryobacteraceae bacterium]